jgi:Inner membrane component of T3SS, cytoplasmic domain
MGDSERHRLVISEDDLPPETAARTSDLESPQLPRVRGAEPGLQVDVGAGRRSVPSGEQHGNRTPADAVVSGGFDWHKLLIAACSVIPGWVVGEAVLAIFNPSTAFGLDVVTGIWTAVVGLSFATLLVGWDYVYPLDQQGLMHSLKQAGTWGAAFGFVGGFIGSAVYVHFVHHILDGLTLSGLVHLSSNGDLYLARAIAWGLFGAGMGIAVAGGFGSDQKKLVNGLLGGAVGGAIGGLFFNWAAFNISSGGISRLVGVVIIAAVIVFAVGVVERVRRDAWLFVSGGPMTGKEFIVYGGEFTIGSAPECDMTIVRDPGVAPHHMTIRTDLRDAGHRRIADTVSEALLLVNGARAAAHPLKPGDVLTLGSTALVYDERNTAGFN